MVKDLNEPPPTVPKNWDRCHAYLEQKKRFCRQRPNDSSSIYCGNHQHLVATTERKRIPCPIDPSHLIFEDMIEKHSLICPRVKKRKRQEDQLYYRQSVNSGGHGEWNESEGKSAVLDLQWAQKIALRVLQVHQRIFLSSEESQPSKITLTQLHNAIPLCDLSQPELDSGMIDAIQENKIKSGGARHIPQLASLVGHLRALDVLPSIGAQPSERNPLLLLEMGAGRGVFGLTAAGVAAANKIPTQLIMVERTGSRSKADKIFRTLPSSKDDKSESYLKLESIKWSRLECDLAHVNLPVVLTTNDFVSDEDTKIVVIAKHLCGAGTDLALKSIEPIRERVHSCVLATCCHGICNWDDYVGRNYLCKAMNMDGLLFGPKEFDLMRQWCAGSVATPTMKKVGNHIGDEGTDVGSRADEEEEIQHTTKANVVDNSTPKASDRVNISSVVDSLGLECGIEGLGRACQRVIDFGRREYLRNIIFNTTGATSELVHYVPSHVSPQNACLVGRRL